MSYYGWKPYVSVAERRRKAEKAAAKAKKAGAGQLPIEPSRGAVAKTFWGKAWCENLERYSDYANRLPRGRSYVRNGSVIDLQLDGRTVSAQVMGSSLYRVEVKIKVVPAAQWERIATDCSGAIDTLVELLQGKLSRAVMERISKPGEGLFPAPREIEFQCSCPDWASMCKHVAAVLYGVGNRLDTRPELLFALRGVDAADLIADAADAKLSAPTVAADKLLDSDSLADVFGIELAAHGVATAKKRKAASPGRKSVATPKSAATPKPAAKVKKTAIKKETGDAKTAPTRGRKKAAATTPTASPRKVAAKPTIRQPAKAAAKSPAKSPAKKAPSARKPRQA